MKLHDKVAVVTGGGRGIGRAIALALASEGADVCVVARSPNEIDKVAGEIRELGRRALALPCNVANFAEIERLFGRAAGELGGIDILVNNAGGGFARGPIAESDPEIWRQVVEVNLLGVYYCCRAGVPHLRSAGGGKIINVGSGMGHTPRPNNAAYNTAKAGLWMFTQCLALEVWEDGIEVNELIPGPVYTKLTEDYFQRGKTPPIADSERVKEPQDCVPLAMFLAAHPPGGPTGQSFSLARRPL